VHSPPNAYRLGVGRQYQARQGLPPRKLQLLASVYTALCTQFNAAWIFNVSGDISTTQAMDVDFWKRIKGKAVHEIHVSALQPNYWGSRRKQTEEASYSRTATSRSISNHVAPFWANNWRFFLVKTIISDLCHFYT
jgi:hypothetical protein